MSDETFPGGFDDVIYGPANINGSIDVSEFRAQFNIVPDTAFDGADEFDRKNVWYVTNGGLVESLRPNASLAQVTTDGAQTDSTAALETAPVLAYRPGTQVDASTGVFLDVPPTGDAKYEIAYGREPRTLTDPLDGSTVEVGNDYLAYRIRNDGGTTALEFAIGQDFDDDGTAEENVVPITNGSWSSEEVAAKFTNNPKGIAYGHDPLDGEGPSGIDYDPTHGYVYGFLIGWYGPSAVTAYVVDTRNISGAWKERRYPVLTYQPSEDPAINRPNQPIRVYADNATSGDDLQARVGGRQGSFRGETTAPPDPLEHKQTGVNVPVTGGTTGTEGLNWHVVAVAKARTLNPDAVIGFIEFIAAADDALATQWRLVDESDLSATPSYDEFANIQGRYSKVAIDGKTDTPTRISLNTSSVDGETKFRGIKADGHLYGASQSFNVFGSSRRPFAFSFVRDKCLVLLCAARGSSDLSLDYSLSVAAKG